MQLKLSDSPDDLWYSWFVGLVDGEGSFIVQVKDDKCMKDGRNVQLSFQIGLSEKDSGTIDEIKQKLGVGGVYTINYQPRRNKGEDKKDQKRYMVTSISELSKIIVPIFRKYNLRTKKKEDFEKWVTILKMIRRKEHLTDKGFLKICEIFKGMNERGFCGNTHQKKYISRLQL